MENQKMKPKKTQAQEIRSFCVMLALVMSFRFIIAEPFSIPSPSMVPTMLIGDYLYVSKISYGISNYSFALFSWHPHLFKGRIWGRSPTQGDVAVFIGVRDCERYIKRVIGHPGDTIDMKQGVLYVNGVEAKQRRIEDYVEKTAAGRLKNTPQYIETLPNGVEHRILRESPEGTGSGDNEGPYHVPEDQYFMMGDNRNHSGDSRFAQMGTIPFENFLGPAKFTFFSIDSSILDLWKVWEWPEILRPSRIFKPIH